MNKFKQANEEWKALLNEFKVTQLERWVYLIGLLSFISLGIAHFIELGLWNPVGAVNMMSNPRYAMLFMLTAPLSLMPVKVSIRHTIGGLEYRAQLERKGFLFGVVLSMALVSWIVIGWNLPWVILAVFIAYHILQYLMLEDAIQERGEELTEENLTFDEWYAKTKIDEEAAWMEKHLAEGKALGRAEYLDRKGDVKAWIAGIQDSVIKYRKEAKRNAVRKSEGYSKSLFEQNFKKYGIIHLEIEHLDETPTLEKENKDDLGS